MINVLWIATLSCIFHCNKLYTRVQSIGAVNTIIRRPGDGKLIGYNTDCEASITAVEDALKGKDKGYSILLLRVTL